MRKKGASDRKRRWLGLVLLPCAALLVSSFVVLSIETVAVRNIRGNGYQFNELPIAFADLFANPAGGGYTDEELLFALHERLEGDVKNPYTDQPIIIEASPGNFAVQRENGGIIGISLDHRSGAERVY